MTNDRPTVESLLARIRPKRVIDACSAVFLPHDAQGGVDWEGFEDLLRLTTESGLTPAINMDTGFGPQLGPEGRTRVLRFTRETLGPDARIIAGASMLGVEGVSPPEAYRRSIDEIAQAGATPIIFQSDWLSAKRDAELADAYRQIIGDSGPALGFELGQMFAPFGRIYSLDEYKRLLEIEPLVGLKHSSLDRLLELDRLDARDATRPEFKLYTGNDLAIDMVMYGSDYLLGLSAFDPPAFAQRDTWWAEGDARFYALNDALQALGAVGFRDPVPAYKDSAAHYLMLTGKLDAATVHPECPTRPEWEADLLAPLHAQITKSLAD